MPLNSKYSEVSFSPNSTDLFLRVAKCLDVQIRRFFFIDNNNNSNDRTDYFIPCACTWGNDSGQRQFVRIVEVSIIGGIHWSEVTLISVVTSLEFYIKRHNYLACGFACLIIGYALKYYSVE